MLLLLDRLLFLQVLGDDHAGDALLGQSDAERAIDGMPDRGSRRDRGDEIVGHVLEERLQIDLLLVVAAERSGGGLTDDRDHRLVIHARVVQPVQQVDGPRSGSGEAHSWLPGKFCVRSRHERGQLFVACLDEARALVAGVLEPGHDPVDAVPRIAEHALDAPGTQPFDDEISHRLRHGPTSASG